MNLATIMNTFFLMSAFSAIKDKKRITAVLDCINALNENDTLTLTGLGLGMKNTKTKVTSVLVKPAQGNYFLTAQTLELLDLTEVFHLLGSRQ